jgi:hypothetical protein
VVKREREGILTADTSTRNATCFADSSIKQADDMPRKEPVRQAAGYYCIIILKNKQKLVTGLGQQLQEPKRQLCKSFKGPPRRSWRQDLGNNHRNPKDSFAEAQGTTMCGGGCRCPS